MGYKYNQPTEGQLLPEYHQSTHIEGSLPVLPHTDIYYLDLLLWRIVTIQAILLYSKAYKDVTSASEGEPKNTKPYVAKLPWLDEQVPQRLREIIAACFTEDPNKRPVAWELLKMFSDRKKFCKSAVDREEIGVTHLDEP